MAASAACSHPHLFAHTLRFSERGFLALTKNAWFVEVPIRLFPYSLTPYSTYLNLYCRNPNLGLVPRRMICRRNFILECVLAILPLDRS